MPVMHARREAVARAAAPIDHEKRLPHVVSGAAKMIEHVPNLLHPLKEVTRRATRVLLRLDIEREQRRSVEDIRKDPAEQWSRQRIQSMIEEVRRERLAQSVFGRSRAIRSESAKSLRVVPLALLPVSLH